MYIASEPRGLKGSVWGRLRRLSDQEPPSSHDHLPISAVTLLGAFTWLYAHLVS